MKIAVLSIGATENYVFAKLSQVDNVSTLA